MTTPEDFIKGDITISSLPDVFTRLDNAINDPRGSLSVIADLISKDAGLTARLLKIANSALFKFSNEIVTISQAVTVIGMQQLRDLILATSVIDMFQQNNLDKETVNSFWHHNIACGITARVIATYRREVNVERFYVSGILHDLGRLVIYMKAPELTKITQLRANTDKTTIYESEQKILGFDHAAVGGKLLSTWNLPDSLIQMVSYHHNPSASPNYPLEASIIHMADIISCAMQLGFSAEDYVPPLDPAAWEMLGLKKSVLTGIMNQVDQQFADAINIFVRE